MCFSDLKAMFWYLKSKYYKNSLKRPFNPHQADVSEFLIMRGRGEGGKYALQTKSAISAIFLHSKLKNHIKGLEGYKSWPLQGLGQAIALHWALQGPSKGPCDFWDSARLFYLLYKIHSLNFLLVQNAV